MTEQTRVEELEAYVAMMELDFEAKVQREVDERLSDAVEEEINRRSSAKVFDLGKKHGRWIKGTFGKEPAGPAKTKFGQDGLYDVDCDF